MFKNILVPLDGSDLAASILPQVEDLAKSEKAQITLLTVGHVPGVFFMDEPDAAIITTMLERLEKSAVKYLEDTAKTLKEKGLNVTWVYREGPPAGEIIRYADKSCCDLIAMATHGRGEIAWVLGSVAEQVVSHATVPVLLMRVLKVQPLLEKQELLTGP